jgi:hypothetical protein
MSPLVAPPVIPLGKVLNTLDDAAFTDRSREFVGALPAWIDPLTLRLQALHTLQGSRFEVDDALKPTNPPSEQVINLLRSAHDHLRALADAVSGSGLRPLAGFTLIRSAIEASALAAWLMLPNTIDARLRNSIRLSVENRKDTETYTKRFGADDRVSKWFVAEMEATKAQRPGTKNMDLAKNFATLTSIIAGTDKRQKFTGLTGLDAWRACSGIAHSNAQFADGSLTKVQSPDSIDVKVRLTTLMMMLQPAEQYFEFSLELAERYLAPTPGRPAAAESAPR